MKLRKEQQLIKDFIFLKYNDFNLEALEKGIKIMYNMQKYNLIMQGSNTTRNRVLKYAYLDFIFTLPSINRTICD